MDVNSEHSKKMPAEVPAGHFSFKKLLETLYLIVFRAKNC